MNKLNPIQPLQAIFVTKELFRTINFSPSKKVFERVTTVLIDNSSLSLKKITDVENSSILPSIVILDTVGMPPEKTWKLMHEIRNQVSAAKSGPIGLIVSNNDYMPFSKDLLPSDMLVQIVPDSSINGDLTELRNLGRSRLARISLVEPERLSFNCTYHSDVSKIDTPMFGSSIREVIRTANQDQHVIPCFNIKSPTMVWLLAIAARNSGIPMILEISPSELIRHFVMNGNILPSNANDIHNRLIEGFISFSCLVRKVASATNTENLIFSQLDHSRSPEFVEIAYSAGMDIAMFDGSSRPLSVNQELTRRLANIAHNSGYAIEAEVDSVDDVRGELTKIDDAVQFADESGVDLLAVAMGQKHGSDYSVPPLIEGLEEIARLQNACHGSGVHQFMLEAIETKIKNSTIFLSSRDIQWLRDLHHHILSDRNLTDGKFFEQHSAFPDPLLVEEMEVSTREIRRKSEIRLTELLQKITSCGLKPKQQEGKRQVQLGHLKNIHNKIKQKLGDSTPGLVLHGGSNINHNSLSELSNAGVRKINFGSSLFRAFYQNMIDADEAFFIDQNTGNNQSMRRLLEADWVNSSTRDTEELEHTYSSFLDFVKVRYLHPISSNKSISVFAVPPCNINNKFNKISKEIIYEQA